jgi:predicted nucleic acid-binding protein
MSASAHDRRVFVDTSAYFAVANRRDVDHAAASATMQRLIQSRCRLITTNVVLFELHGLMVNRISREVAWNALVALRASQTIVRVRPADEARAEEILAQYGWQLVPLTGDAAP